MLLDGSEHSGLILAITSLAAGFFAQILKVLTNFVMIRKVDFTLFIKTGGMPSSHSAMTTSLTTGVALVEGFDSTLFAVSLIFALIVMYDATSVRRSVGVQARMLNRMIEELPQQDDSAKFARIKEFLGHTPIEVIVGGVFGGAFAWLICSGYNLN